MKQISNSHLRWPKGRRSCVKYISKERINNESIAELPYSWEKIKDKTILVSGGTGFIGTAFVDVIKYRNQKYNENIKVISFSRRGGESSEYLECIKANVKQPLHYEGKIDYIINGLNLVKMKMVMNFRKQSSVVNSVLSGKREMSRIIR